MSDSDMSMSVADRTSELPEAILHHILSYLPIREAACTSILSKWWNNAWETLPHLNIREENFKSCCLKNRNSVIQKIVQSRIRQQISIEKFRLVVSGWQERSMCLRIGLSNISVIRYVATPFLRELELNHDIKGNVDLLLPPPPSLLSAKWLTTLSLFGFDCSFWSSLDIKFTCLQNLSLAYVSLDSITMKSLILGSCSSLDTLKLDYCKELKKLHLTGEFVKLKQLMVKLCPEVALEVHDVPLLSYLEVLDSPKCLLNLENCPRLWKLRYHCDSGIMTNIFPHLWLSSNQLEKLNIENCSLLNQVHIYSHTLIRVNLVSLENLENLYLFSPNLQDFTSNLPLSSFFSIPNLNFPFHCYSELNLIMGYFGLKLAKFISHFKNVRSLTLETPRIEMIPDHRKLEFLSPMLATTCITAITMEHTVPELVQYFLWLAPRVEKLSITLQETIELSIELVYQKEGEYEETKNLDCPYCKFLPIDCWRHCLKEVGIKKFEGRELYLARTKDFFLKEIKNLKIIDI